MTEIENKVSNLLNPDHDYVVALSGGVDSSVLLHLVRSYTANVRSVFVNHNQKDSNELQKSAENIAIDLEINHLNIDTELESGASETKMRKARYKALLNNMKQDEVLLLGHHNDDRVETFLINLFRGTRLKGLVSIKQESRSIVRPLIDIKKSSIIQYAKDKNINFLEDSTNKDNSILRNWLRNEIIPSIEKNFKGDLNKKIQGLIYEIDELTKNNKDLISYIKIAKGYVEVPISLIDKDNSTSYYLLSIISQHIGQNGLQNSDLHKIFSIIAENKRKNFYENWEVSTQSGLLVFVNKEKWLSSKDLYEPKGYFYFKKHHSIGILNNWSISLPKYLENEIYFTEISDGDVFKVDSHNQKVTELFRSYGVNKSLREVWPVLKLKDTILWIPGVRKSNEGNWLETQKDKFIISASTEKVSIENF